MSKLIARRSLLVGGVASLICAPAIVRAENIMPVKAIPDEITMEFDGSAWRLMEPMQRYVFHLIEKDSDGIAGWKAFNSWNPAPPPVALAA